MPEITCVCGLHYNPKDASAVKRHEQSRGHIAWLPKTAIVETTPDEDLSVQGGENVVFADDDSFSDLDDLPEHADAVADPRSLEEIADSIAPTGETRAKAVKRAKAKVAAKVENIEPDVKAEIESATNEAIKSKPRKTKVETTPAAGADKPCRVCKKVKPLDEYRVKSSRPDGRDTICATCAHAYDVAHKAAKAAAK